jgi:hypothetical protein
MRKIRSNMLGLLIAVLAAGCASSAAMVETRPVFGVGRGDYV